MQRRALGYQHMGLWADRTEDLLSRYAPDATTFEQKRLAFERMKTMNVPELKAFFGEDVTKLPRGRTVMECIDIMSAPIFVDRIRDDRFQFHKGSSIGEARCHVYVTPAKEETNAECLLEICIGRKLLYMKRLRHAEGKTEMMTAGLMKSEEEALAWLEKNAGSLAAIYPGDEGFSHAYDAFTSDIMREQKGRESNERSERN